MEFAGAAAAGPGIGLTKRRKRWVYIRDLVYELVARDIKLRYKRSYLGLAWSLINPLLQLLVFQFVFTAVLPLSIPHYTVFLFTGILSWTWFSTALYAATSSIVDNPPMIRHPGFPVTILPVITVTAAMVNFLLALPILIVFLLAGGFLPTPAMAALPLVIAIQFLFTASLSYLLAAAHVPFRDTQYLLGIFLTLGFYLAPIFYKSDAIPQTWQPLYRINPMVPILEAYRAVLMDGRLPEWGALAAVAAGSALLLLLSYSLFVRASHHFVEQL